MPRFRITTLGCKINQYEGHAVAATLRQAGAAPAERGERPDLLIIHTCCITAAAMRKSRQAIRRAVRQAPGAAVLITGCYADYDPLALRRLLSELPVPPERTVVAGHHGDLAGSVQQVLNIVRNPCPVAVRSGVCPRKPTKSSPLADGRSEPPRPPGPPGGPPGGDIRTRRDRAVKANAPGARHLAGVDRFDDRQRAFVKVQDGCDACCAYCVVPLTRPVVWSRPPDEIEAQCRRLVAAGHKELVLCGVCLGAFGRTTCRDRRDRPGGALPALLRRIARIDGLWRVRLSSLSPIDATDELMEVFRQTPTVAPHLHLSLQSGSDRLLRCMNRPYGADAFLRAAERAHALLDRPAVTADAIVGFPSETDEDFQATCRAVRQAGLSKVHVFPFSPMPGTAAWDRRRDAAPPAVMRRRAAELRRLAEQLACAYRRRFVGDTIEALVESAPGPAEIRRAMTDRYVTAAFPAPCGVPPERLTGQVVRLRIGRATDAGLWGRLAELP